MLDTGNGLEDEEDQEAEAEQEEQEQEESDQEDSDQEEEESDDNGSDQGQDSEVNVEDEESEIDYEASSASSTPEPTALPRGSKSKAAWTDQSLKTMVIPLSGPKTAHKLIDGTLSYAGTNKLKKLREEVGENEIRGDEYERRLRKM